MLRLIVFVFFIVINTSVGASNQTVDPSVSWFLKSTPFFDLTKVPQISATCRKDFQEFLTALDNLELWALKSEKLLGDFR